MSPDPPFAFKLMFVSPTKWRVWPSICLQTAEYFPPFALKSWDTDGLRRETQLGSLPAADLGHACIPGREITGAGRAAVGGKHVHNRFNQL